MSHKHHTPWQVKRSVDYSGAQGYIPHPVVMGDGGSIWVAEVNPHLKDPEEVARIMAAAPKLLDALNGLVAAVKSRGVLSTVKALAKADAAIALTDET